MRMHPATLAFADPQQERRFRRDHARRSVPYLRVLLVFAMLLTTVLGYMTGLAAEVASWHGLDRLESLAIRVPLVTVGSVATYAMLLGISYWPPAMKRLQLIVAIAFFVGFLLDAPMMVGGGPDFALGAAITSVVASYFALRLRIVPAVVMGSAVTALYLAASAVTNEIGRDPSEDAVLTFMVSTVFLVATNAVCGFVAYQYEVLARNQFLQTELIERQKKRLEDALRDLKETESQLIESEKQASLGRFVAGLLHEVNSPLGALTSATGTIETGLSRCEELLDELPPRDDASLGVALATRDKARRSIVAARKLLELQGESADRIRHLVDDLKGFIGLDAAERQPVDIQRGLDSALRLLADSMTENVVVERDVPNQPVLVDSTPGLLNQVFLRLLQNSVEVLNGEGKIRIQVRHCGERARIVIEDNGPGIPRQRLSSLFDPSLIREGTRVKMNLGLPTSKRAIEKLGGQLSLQSEEGRGTTVTIEVPCLPASAPPTEASSVDRSADPR